MPQQPIDATGERILDAAMATLVEFGVKRTSMESIARRADVSHMTVYRRWRRKDDLLSALLIRESQRLFVEVDAEVATQHAREDKLLAGFTTIFWYFYAHPLLRKAVRTEPENVLPALTLNATPAMQVAITYLTDRVVKADGAADPDVVAEAMVRITHSLLLTSWSTERFTTRDEVREYGLRYLLPLVGMWSTSSPLRR